MACLGSFNRERKGTTLDTYLLSKDREAFYMPWETLVCPEIVSKMKMIRDETPTGGAMDNGTGSDTGPLSSTKDFQQEGDWTNQEYLPVSRPVEPDHMADTLDHVMDNLDHVKDSLSHVMDNLSNEGEHAVGDDITLPRFSPYKGSLTQSISLNCNKKTKPRTSEEDLSKTTEGHLKSSTCTPTMDCTKSDKENQNSSPSKPFCSPINTTVSVTNTTSEALTLQNSDFGVVDSLFLEKPTDASVSERSSCAAPASVYLLSQATVHSWQSDSPGDPAHSKVSLLSHKASLTAIMECEEATAVDRGGAELAHGLNDTAVREVMILKPVPAWGNSDQEASTQAGATGGHGHIESFCALVSCGEKQALPQTEDNPLKGVDVFLASGRASCDHLKSSVTGAEGCSPCMNDPYAECLGQGQCQVTSSVGAEEGPAGVETCHTEWQCMETEASLLTVDSDSETSGTVEVPGQAAEGGSTWRAGTGETRRVREGEGGCYREACTKACTDSTGLSASRQSGDNSDEGSTTESRIIAPETQSAGACDSSPFKSRSGCGGQHIQNKQVEVCGPSEDTDTTPSAAGVGEKRLEDGFMGQVQAQRLEELAKDSEDLTDEGSRSSPEFLVKGSWHKGNEHLLAGCGEDGYVGKNEEALMGKPQGSLLPQPASSETQPALAEAHNISGDVLNSGVLCLPGTRDKYGRALVIVMTRNTAWLNPNCNSSELVRILIYFYNIIRKEVQALGLTVLVDSRRCSPVPALFKAFHIVQVREQEAVPRCIHTILLLADRDLTFRTEKSTSMQFELLTSLKSLHKYVDTSQLPAEFDGTFPFCHNSWIGFRMEAQELLCSYRDQMRNILEDSRLLRLQVEGGAALSRLRKEESSVSLTEDYRDAIEMVSALYDQVDELLHHLVTLSNKSTKQLEFILNFTSLEERFTEVRGWIEDAGEGQLTALCNLEDSLEQLHKQKARFRDFYALACERCKTGEALLQRLQQWEALATEELQEYQVKVYTFAAQLRDFAQRVEDARDKLDKTVKLYEFFDKAYKWSLEGMRHLAGISTEDCSLPEKCHMAVKCLEGYRLQHPEIEESMFQKMKELALELRNDAGLKQWTFAWSKCQETKQMFKKKLEMALQTCHSQPLEGNGEAGNGEALPRVCSGVSVHRQPEAWASSPSCRRVVHGPRARERQATTSSRAASSPARSSLITQDCQLHRSISTNLMCMAPFSHSTQSTVVSSTEEFPCRALHEPQAKSSCDSNSPRKPALRLSHRVLRKTRSFDVSTTANVPWNGTYQRTLSETARHGNTGVFIKGLEVSSTEVADRSFSLRLPARAWINTNNLRFNIHAQEVKAKRSFALFVLHSKLHHIVDEMITTEREYVRSLRYIIDQYFPEMERPDLPQDLRGKRSVIFGNLEKLIDFHSQFFLKELESCCNHPLRVSHCFLRHQDQFGMYALYSKNKPKSDALLATHGNAFFRNKQLELEDKMDLASYLLKPIQRMSKYALLLKDLIKEVSETQEQELSHLRAAAEMVKFQLRHGNDLLAMDAICDCDVNLKEQGQLVRQDEFTIFYGRKRCQRHVFLFEDLVLFSKPKKIERGLDIYIYKHSFKTADIGMTETSGDNSLRFEIWFRRRTSKSQTFILQAGTAGIKEAWTSDIAKILWQQATRNKEIRIQEMVSMGVGDKPFLDIKPSDAAINDRAIDYFMKGRESRTRASIAVSLFDHSSPFNRAQVTVPVGRVSSSSLLGSLNLHMYSNRAPAPGERAFAGPCIEEDEQEHETSSQPSMTTESSESSSHCMSGSGSSGSDSGCAFGNLPEGSSEGSSSPWDPTCDRRVSTPTGDKGDFRGKSVSAVSNTLNCKVQSAVTALNAVKSIIF
ncbi:hypothetical protein Z043_111156 [Scleropages formosus]|uniref:Puratrophin-1-like n=1 Tax=Scleropages formosus TaxID=113540 RepID=A0A0P7UML0_SCLFO|nr:hypothetical protein Z043_111156 [Scleropages formosus]